MMTTTTGETAMEEGVEEGAGVPVVPVVSLEPGELPEELPEEPLHREGRPQLVLDEVEDAAELPPPPTIGRRLHLRLRLHPHQQHLLPKTATTVRPSV